MLRVVGGAVTSVLLVAGLVSCSSDSEPGPTVDASEKVAVERDEVIRHEAAPGTPMSYGLEVPDGAVQVGPLIRQRRLEVEQVIDDPGGGRAEAFENERDDDDPAPETHDPEEPAPADFTTALLRIDGDPAEVMQNMLADIQDAVPDSGVDPEKWSDHCTVSNGVYTGCQLEVSGTTEEDEQISVEVTVDPGNPKTKTAHPGSLLRPVMAVTIELHPPPKDGGDGDDDDGDQSDGPSRDRKGGDERGHRGDRNDNRGHNRTEHDGRNTARETTTASPVDKRDKRNDKQKPPKNDEPKGPEDKKSPEGEPKWPTMERERPAKPGDWILTPAWELRRNTEVILSTSSPSVAMLAIRNGADADAIARRYVRAFADEATTPKMDEVEDPNERSITYTPRNDGTGPSVAVTVVATGRGNYIELLFEADETDTKAEGKPGRKDREAGDKRGRDRGHNRAANRTSSKTG